MNTPSDDRRNVVTRGAFPTEGRKVSAYVESPLTSEATDMRKRKPRTSSFPLIGMKPRGTESAAISCRI
jgi:hypothetical protein